MATEKQILEALSVIIDPDFKKDIVSLGFIKNISIKDDFVAFDIELTTPACPIKVEFQRSAEKVVLALDGVEHVNVNMTSQKTTLQSVDSLKGVKNIIAVSSCKGGVGKSTVAAHLALDLSKRGYKTGLFDVDLFGPSVPTIFNIHESKVRQDKDGKIIPHDENGLKLMSFGFIMKSGPAIMRGPMVSGYLQQVIQGTAWGELDYLILDMPPGTGDIQLSITQLMQISGAVIVTTRQSLSLVDVEKGIEMFEKVQVPMLGVVENMSWFVCDSCDKRHNIFGDAKGTNIKERYGLDTLAELPLNPKLAQKVEDAAGDPDVVAMVDGVVRALGMQSGGPLERPAIVNGDKAITFTWSDGKSWRIPNRELRQSCPCASCIDEYTGEQILEKESIPANIKAEEIVPLGNYAVQISWSDGHSSGIFSYTHLEKFVY